MLKLRQANLFEDTADESTPLSADPHANPPALPEADEAQMTIDGYGLTLCGWCLKLTPCGCWRRTLTESLASKLMALGSVHGLRHSFTLSVMNSGPSASLLKISVRPTAESESGLLPVDVSLEASDWPTPTVNGNHNRKGASEKSGDGLSTKVMESAWPTPCCPNGGRKPAKPMSPTGQTEDGKKRQVDLNYAVTKLWPTREASANENRTTKRPPSHGKGHGRCLAGEVMEDATWATPTSRDYRSIHASEETLERNSRPLSEQVGQLDQDSNNTSGKSHGLALNPRWTLQLMGLPETWLDGVDVPSKPSVTRSSRKRRKS